jgi:MarR family transcriptional regulator for hemolysin
VLEYDWENSVGCWICSTSHALRKALGAALSQEGITLRQFEVLAWLSSGGGCGSQSELADALGIEPHTLAGVLSRMERDGLLRRHACEQDRRKNKIQPTDKAELIWEKVSNICHETRNRAVQDFSQEDLAQLRSLCDRIRANLDEPQAEPMPAPHLSATVAAIR